jgi:carbon monoxide dehydrogenase subunit G
MDFTGRYFIAATPEAVWTGINDPNVLKACIPGCEGMEKTSPTDFVASARIKIGPVSATFKGKVTLSDLDPPNRLVLSGEGQGGVAGFAKGGAEVVLAPEGAGTVLTYVAKATVGGKLAQIGQRLIDGAAKQIADDFFTRFAKAVSPTPEAAFEALPTSVAAPSSNDDMPAAVVSVALDKEPREGVAPEIWVVGLIGVVAILLVLFGLVLR